MTAARPFPVPGAEPLPIAAAEVIPYWLPFRSDYVTARGRLQRREMVLLRLQDEEGREGWGEAVPLSLRGGADLGRVTADLESWATHIRGRSLVPNTYFSSPTEGVSAPARCAIETAVADLAARRAGVPVWRLLGAGEAKAVPCNATLISGPPEAVAADAADWAGDGFTTFKLKVGGGIEADLVQIEAVREAVGADARLRLDANGAWTREEARSILETASAFGIELVEQPLATLDQMAELRRDLKGITIAADESVSTPAEAVAARDSGACDLATVKLSKNGRLQPDLGGALPFYLSSALDGPVGIAAAAHTYQALSEHQRARLPDRPGGGAAEPLAQGLATQRLFATTIAKAGCELREAQLHLPPGSGLGVEIDSDALDAHRL